MTTLNRDQPPCYVDSDQRWHFDSLPPPPEVFATPDFNAEIKHDDIDHEFTQVFEAISTTASGWLGAFAATGLEIMGLKYGTAPQRQAGEARVEGQYQAEAARAFYGRDAANLVNRAQQILGLHSASANRSQALGAITGGYTISVQMTVAQRQATLGYLNNRECNRSQDSSPIEASVNSRQT